MEPSLGQFACRRPGPQCTSGSGRSSNSTTSELARVSGMTSAATCTGASIPPMWNGVRLPEALALPPGDRHRERLARHPHRFRRAVRGKLAPDVAHLCSEHRIVFDPMAVAIDDQMVDFRTDWPGVIQALDVILWKSGSWTAVTPSPLRASANHDLPMRPAPDACMTLDYGVATSTCSRTAAPLRSLIGRSNSCSAN
jgi:hypothetical protein